PMAGGQISGTVTDAASGEGIPTATIAVWKAADSTLATGAVAEDDGTFQIEGIRPGRYYVRVSFLGYTTQTIDDVALTPQSPLADLGEIELKQDTQHLQEVQVTAQRDFMEVHIDKTVYNTKDQLISTGGSAIDVLRNIPSIDVDTDGQVSLRGSQNVAVLINGRPSPMTGTALASFLQSLPASSIEKVEVIPNPSAKYEPDGMSGILNIVLKKQTDTGLNGSATASANTNAGYNLGGNLNYQKGKLSLSGTYGFRHDKRNSSGTSWRENRFLDVVSYLDQLQTENRYNYSHTLNGSLDYTLSKYNSLSASGLLSIRPVNKETSFSDYTDLDASQILVGRFGRTAVNRQSGLNMDYSAAFRHVVEASRNELTAEARFSRDTGDERAHFEDDSLQTTGAPLNTWQHLQNNNTDEQTDQGSFQVDYVRPLGVDGKLEAGYKGTLRELNNDFFSETFDAASNAYLPDDSLNNTFAYDEQVHAAYLQTQQTFGAFSVQAGLRAEEALTSFNLKTTNQSFDNDYFSLFPSVFLAYRFGDTRQVKLSYSKRINRPRTWSLNPFSVSTDPLFRFQGNPYLKPEYVHSIELSLVQTSKQTMLTLTPYFRRTVNVIRFIDTFDPSGRTTVTFQNLDKRDSFGAEAIGTLRLGDKLNAFGSVEAYRVNTVGSTQQSSLSNNAFGWSTRVNATYKVTPNLDVQASWFYRAPMKIEQGRMGSFSRTDFAVRQQLLNKKASLSLRVSDPFATMGFRISRDTPNFSLQNTRKFQSRFVTLSLTYNFGQQNTRRPRRNMQPDQQQGGDDMQQVPIG
ncbi:MAG TPA: TonB-dependent receptor, partial [Rhodothermales bacterium]|nr:TonB-dependent receptor [Rhodothermales bacterium]